MTPQNKYAARLTVVMNEYADEIARPIRAELSVQKTFADSAQTHAAELEVELKKCQAELQKKRDLIWTMVEYMNLRDELKDFEQRMLDKLKESV